MNYSEQQHSKYEAVKLRKYMVKSPSLLCATAKAMLPQGSRQQCTWKKKSKALNSVHFLLSYEFVLGVDGTA